jgi:hypothetical protein
VQPFPVTFWALSRGIHSFKDALVANDLPRLLLNNPFAFSDALTALEPFQIRRNIVRTALDPTVLDPTWYREPVPRNQARIWADAITATESRIISRVANRTSSDAVTLGSLFIRTPTSPPGPPELLGVSDASYCVDDMQTYRMLVEWSTGWDGAATEISVSTNNGAYSVWDNVAVGITSRYVFGVSANNNYRVRLRHFIGGTYTEYSNNMATDISEPPC